MTENEIPTIIVKDAKDREARKETKHVRLFARHDSFAVQMIGTSNSDESF